MNIGCRLLAKYDFFFQAKISSSNHPPHCQVTYVFPFSSLSSSRRVYPSKAYTNLFLLLLESSRSAMSNFIKEILKGISNMCNCFFGLVLLLDIREQRQTEHNSTYFKITNILCNHLNN